MSLKKILPAVLLSGVCLMATILSGGAVAHAQSPPSKTAGSQERDLYAQGQKHFAQGDYGKAVNAFRQLLTDYPQTPIRDLTLLWLGRSYIKAGRIDEAAVVGEALRAIPDTPFADIYATELRLAGDNQNGISPAAKTSPETTVTQPLPPAPQPSPADATAAANPPPDATNDPVEAAPIAVANAPSTAKGNALPADTATTDPVAPPAENAVALTATDEIVKPAPVKIRLELAQSEYVVRPGEAVNLPVRIFNNSARAVEFVLEVLSPNDVSSAFALTPDAAPEASVAKLTTPIIAANSYADVWLTLRYTAAADSRPRQFLFPVVVTVAGNPLNNAQINISLNVNPKAKRSDTKIKFPAPPQPML